MTKVASCSPADPSGKTVMLIKQWHLSPTTITKNFKEKYPQERNQTAIYANLADNIKKGKIQLIVAEGCQGEIKFRVQDRVQRLGHSSPAKDFADERIR
ncbi:MAG: hypothetical protein HC902_07015 [Calothrix sp. SM1_5_4]|nr:hypothetical protein [Calothrix sp. SM1_5_4]